MNKEGLQVDGMAKTQKDAYSEDSITQLVFGCLFFDPVSSIVVWIGMVRNSTTARVVEAVHDSNLLPLFIEIALSLSSLSWKMLRATFYSEPQSVRASYQLHLYQRSIFEIQ